MDQISAYILNSTFSKLQNQMLQRFQEIKSKMPRRESARRSHHLACESDIVETLHMRLTLLQMSFGKHIERKHCCFFPGEILDEVYSILHYIRVSFQGILLIFLGLIAKGAHCRPLPDWICRTKSPTNCSTCPLWPWNTSKKRSSPICLKSPTSARIS